jgi:hypothetical protein
MERLAFEGDVRGGLVMRAIKLFGIFLFVAAAGCGLENLFSNAAHEAYPRPASVIRGTYTVSGAAASQLSVLDGDGNALAGDKAPFETSFSAGAFELRLPSATYAFMRVSARRANLELRALVPALGEESAVGGVDLDAANLTEALIVEAAISHGGRRFRQLTPAAYLGDGVTTGTRTLIRAALADAGPNPTKELLQWIERILTRYNPNSGVLAPQFFRVPVYDGTWAMVASALDPSWILGAPFDYDGDTVAENSSAKFDAKLAEVAALYRPEGCPDPVNIRLVFTSDFNQGALDGNGAVVNRFKWATDNPQKKMYFVGWVHADSPIQDPVVNLLLGAGVPNTKLMYDDGTNGDEVALDGIWTITFDVPVGLRVGYKYTWGTRGAPWTGSEEWPGNSRLLEVVDVNGDLIVYRRDVFGDEATNKDKANLNNAHPGGTIDWTTDYHACGPEVHEQKFTLHDASTCGSTWWTPESVGPLTVACPAAP